MQIMLSTALEAAHDGIFGAGCSANPRINATVPACNPKPPSAHTTGGHPKMP